MGEPVELRDKFDAICVRGIGEEFSVEAPGFDLKRFESRVLDGWDGLGLMARVRRISMVLREALPVRYPSALAVVRRVAACSKAGFTTLYLPDFVGCHGLGHFDLSMKALREFTHLSSSEFGIRPYLAADTARALAIVEGWTGDADEHVRRLASEGTRPRLPWAARIDALLEDPGMTAPILEALRDDPSGYVKKSVANHLNDLGKDHPDELLRRLGEWGQGHPGRAWIARHALRSLIKAGDRRALAIIGAGRRARGKMLRFSVAPTRLIKGDTVTIEIEFLSRARQRIVIDYAIHYVRPGGRVSRKVFKWRVVEAVCDGMVRLRKRQVIRDFSTRKHYPGRHRVEVMINGESLGESEFVLSGRAGRSG